MGRWKQRLGQWGERLAVAHLRRKGYEILETNYRCAVGEVDVVARQGEYLVFVEVRTRRGQEFGTPEESITTRKRAKLVEVAETYLQEKDLNDIDWRIDVVAVQLTSRGRLLRVSHLPDAVDGWA